MSGAHAVDAWGAAPFELTDEQWSLVDGLFDPPGRRGRPATTPRRQMVEALL